VAPRGWGSCVPAAAWTRLPSPAGSCGRVRPRTRGSAAALASRGVSAASSSTRRARRTAPPRRGTAASGRISPAWSSSAGARVRPGRPRRPQPGGSAARRITVTPPPPQRFARAAIARVLTPRLNDAALANALFCIPVLDAWGAFRGFVSSSIIRSWRTWCGLHRPRGRSCLAPPSWRRDGPRRRDFGDHRGRLGGRHGRRGRPDPGASTSGSAACSWRPSGVPTKLGLFFLLLWG
jgi:hypothetical protein